MNKIYSEPVIREIGSLSELTQVSNKIGSKADQFSATVPLVGSVVPVQP